MVQLAPHWFSAIRLLPSDQYGTVHQVGCVKPYHIHSGEVFEGSCFVIVNIMYLYISSAEGMKAGNYGNLLVLIEQPRGEYAVTIAFLRLVTTLVKVSLYSIKSLVMAHQPPKKQLTCMPSQCLSFTWGII